MAPLLEPCWCPFLQGAAGASQVPLLAVLVQDQFPAQLCSRLGAAVPPQK